MFCLAKSRNAAIASSKLKNMRTPFEGPCTTSPTQLNHSRKDGGHCRHTVCQCGTTSTAAPAVVVDYHPSVTKISLAPRSISIEITEQTLMDNNEDIVRKLHNIELEDNPIAIDDFGTGYSSLSYSKNVSNFLPQDSESICGWSSRRRK